MGTLGHLGKSDGSGSFQSSTQARSVCSGVKATAGSTVLAEFSLSSGLF